MHNELGSYALISGAPEAYGNQFVSLYVFRAYVIVRSQEGTPSGN